MRPFCIEVSNVYEQPTGLTRFCVWPAHFSYGVVATWTVVYLVFLSVKFLLQKER